MRSLVVALLLLIGCGGDSTGPGQDGTLNVRFDAQTCNAGQAEVFVDGATKGSYAWQPGVGRDFGVVAGQHTVGAREIGGTLFVWPPLTVTVPAGGVYNAIFTC